MAQPEAVYSIPWQSVRHPFLRWVLRQTHGLIEAALGLRRLNRVYERVKRRPIPGSFPHRILAAMDVRTEVTPADVARIPAEGALMVVANHPFGAVEGLALLELVRRRRPDVKVMANYILARIPELRGEMFFVDPFDDNWTVQLVAVTDPTSIIKVGGATVGANLSVVGDASAQNVTVSGAITADSAEVDGALSAGNTTVNGTLTATGNVTAPSATVNGEITASGTVNAPNFNATT